MSCVRPFLFSLTIAAARLATASPVAKAATNRQLAQVEANRPPTHLEPNLGQNPAGVRFSARGRGAGASFLFSTAGAKTSPEVKLRFVGAKNCAAAAIGTGREVDRLVLRRRRLR